MTPAVTPRIELLPHVQPTSVLVVRAYMLGDFMRAFGIAEETIQKIQMGYANGEFSGVTIRGVDFKENTVTSTTLIFDDIVDQAKLNINMFSNVSVTEQLSRRLAAAIEFAVESIRARHLIVRFSYLVSPVGQRNLLSVFERYSIAPSAPHAPPPGKVMKEIFSIHHKPTGTTITHASARTRD